MIDIERIKRIAKGSVNDLRSYVRHMNQMESLALAEMAEDDVWRTSLVECMEALDSEGA